MFERLVWQPDRMLLDDLVFRLEHYRSDDWSGGDHFRFYKIKELVDQYADFFSRHPDFRAERILEVGIFDGGSTAFWQEVLHPSKLVALDIKNQTDSAYFRRYVESRGLEGRVKTYWNTNQADQPRLGAIVDGEFDSPLDLVIDDASHLYEPTRASFERLFPLCRSGALYIVEDWAWGHWPEFLKPDHAWVDQEPLTQLIVEFIEAAGTSTQLISRVEVYQGFVAVERGPQPLDPNAAFKLKDHIVRREVRRKDLLRKLARTFVSRSR